MQNLNTPQIFFSYANQDQTRVIPYHDALKRSSFNVWLDCKQIKPGQNWDFEIKRALEKSSLVIVFLSKFSIERRGYVQRELKLALDKLSEKLIDDIYIIPILLEDDVIIPEQIKGIQCIFHSDKNCITKVQDALNFQLKKLGIETQAIQNKEKISWTYGNKTENWDGLPGYEVEIQFINLQSEKYPVVDDINQYVNGTLLKKLFEYRNVKLEQCPERFNYGQEEFYRKNTLDAHSSEPYIQGRVLTIEYAIHWYSAGAAHPNSYFLTYSFILDSQILIESIDQIFTNSSIALSVVQNHVRNTLKNSLIDESENATSASDIANQIEDGTLNWENFRSFIFKENGIVFLFAPYHVAAYACGPQLAEVPYEILLDYIKPEYQSALSIEYLKFRRN